MMNGTGIYIFSDGSRYEGEFYKNKRSGFGIFKNKIGDKYIGQWKNNKR